MIISTSRAMSRLGWAVAVIAVCGAPLTAQAPASQENKPQDPAAALVKQARELNREGKHAEALAAYRKAIQTAPKSYEGYLGAGMMLDLMGRYGEARKDLAKAIELAPERAKPQARKMMAISYAFTREPEKAKIYERQAFDQQLAAKDFYAAGETADELARIYLESGDINAAEEWYKMGRDTGLRKPDLSDAERALWDFRWEHAEARIAGRRGQKAQAEKHVAAAKAILDKGYPWQKQQAEYFPYLTGYVAYYTGDDKAALADLQKANQRDPFILGLIAQTYQKLGENAQAMAYYRKVLESNAHNPTNAFARPMAERALRGEHGARE